MIFNPINTFHIKRNLKKITNILYFHTIFHISMNNYTIVHIQTIGLPIQKGYDEYYPYSHNPGYENSRIVTLSWGRYSDNHQIKLVSRIIKPVDFVIPSDSIRFHGITSDVANREGCMMVDVLREFYGDIMGSVIVCHNLNFVINIILNEAHRLDQNNLIDYLEGSNKICTGRSTMALVGLRNNAGGYKMPKLGELYKWCARRELPVGMGSIGYVKVLASIYGHLVRYYMMDGGLFIKK